MIENLLIQPFPGCSPEAKYLALKIVALYGAELPRQLRVEDVSIAATLPRARTSKLMSELENHGVLSVEERSDGPGRPKRIYDLSRDLRRRSADRPVPASLLKSAVTTLLKTNRGKLNQDINSKFAASTVLLLAFLTAKASSTGAVRNLSATEIEKRTGLNAKRQKTHLTKLKEAGFLLHKVRGTVAPNLLGKASGSFWLNFQHVFFRSVGCWPSLETRVVPLNHWAMVHMLLSNRDKDSYKGKIDRVIKSLPTQFFRNFGEELQETILSGPITDNQLSPLLDIEDLDTQHAYLCTCEELTEQLLKSMFPSRPDALTKRQQLNLCRQLYRRLIPRKNRADQSSETKKQRKLLINLHVHLIQGLAYDIHQVLKPEIDSKSLTELTIVPMGHKLSPRRSVILIIEK